MPLLIATVITDEHVAASGCKALSKFVRRFVVKTPVGGGARRPLETIYDRARKKFIIVLHGTTNCGDKSGDRNSGRKSRVPAIVYRCLSLSLSGDRVGHSVNNDDRAHVGEYRGNPVSAYTGAPAGVGGGAGTFSNVPFRGRAHASN